MGDQPPPASAVENYKKLRVQAVETPRLMSVQGYQDLFDMALENSTLRKRQDETEKQIQNLWVEIANLKMKDKDLKENIDQNEEAAKIALAESVSKQADENKSIR